MEVKKCANCGSLFKGGKGAKYCCKACQKEEERRTCGEKCRRCGYSYIYSTQVHCDYSNIMGHSRGCSIADCQIYKDVPREWGDTKSKAVTVQKPKKKKVLKKDSAEVQALYDAIMGGKHEKV